MSGEEILLQRAQESLKAAKILVDQDLPNFAASRAYYAMFYMAELLLQQRGQSFSSHSAVVAAFGKGFARTKELDPKFHQYLIAAQNARLIGDYGGEKSISTSEARQVIQWAEEFITAAQNYIHRD